MFLTSKDALGLALAAGTIVMLLAHGEDRHDTVDGASGSSVPAGAAPTAQGGRPEHEADAREPARVVAFVDVRLVHGSASDGEPGSDRGGHVVVVRDGVVAEIGRSDTVRLPANAIVVDCAGSSYLVSVPDDASVLRWMPVSAGSTDDLLLLASDPRIGDVGPEGVRGRLVDGHWVPSPSETGVLRVDLGAGH